MTEKRLYAIMNKIMEKYADTPTYVAKDLVIRDVGAVLRGLYKSENFLTSFKVDLGKKVILCSDPEKDLPYVSFLPYIVPELQGKREDEEVFLMYAKSSPKVVCLMGTISFIDLRLTSFDEIGFDLRTHDAQLVGYYNASTNEFNRGR